jgi:hypothetical protein
MPTALDNCPRDPGTDPGCWALQKDDEKDDKQDESEQAYSDIHRRLLSGKARTSVHPAVSDASASSRKPEAKTPTPHSGDVRTQGTATAAA